jgi:hypothetical protein
MKYGVKYDVPSTFTTILYLYMNICIFGVLAWYFDHVDSSNRGKTYGYFFFLEKSYWCGRKNSRGFRSNKIHDLQRELDETVEQKNLLEKRESLKNSSGLYIKYINKFKFN